MNFDPFSLNFFLDQVDIEQMSEVVKQGDPWKGLPKITRLKIAGDYLSWVVETAKVSGHLVTYWNKSRSRHISVPESGYFEPRADQLAWLERWCEQNDIARVLGKRSLSSVDVEWLLHHSACYCSGLWLGPAGDEFDHQVFASVESLKKAVCKT